VWSLLLFGTLALFAAPTSARGENEGLEDLDQATQLKVNAEGLADLNDVIDRLESALEKGLDDDNRAFAEDLLVSTLLQRGTTLSAAILDRPLQDPRRDPRWMQVRQFALTDLQRALALDDKLWEAHLLVGRLQALPLGDPRAAQRALTKVIDAADAPADERAQALAVRGALDSDKAKREADFSRAIELEPGKPDYYRVRAQYYYSEDKFAEALADIDKALELEPGHAASQELRGLILLGLDRLDEALATFNKAGELAPDALLPYQHRGEVYRRQGDLEKAVEQLTKALQIVPNDTATLVLRASLYYQLNDAAHALEDVEKAIQLQPQLLVPHLLRAEICAATDRVDEAIKQLERLVPLAPNEAKLLEPLATYYLVGGRPRKAIEAFSKLIESNPDNFRALRFRGDAYLNIGQHAEAVADFNRALELDDTDDGVLNNFAWVLATSPDDEVRDGKRAVELATKAAELSSYQVPHILSTLAAAYAETGDFENAVKWSRKSVELAAKAVESADDEAERTKRKADHKQLEKELETYQADQPVRERQEQEEDATSDAAPAETSHTFAPPSATPAPARTLDF
jgi:tetratricopeptide (TPR) repeat protein